MSRMSSCSVDPVDLTPIPHLIDSYTFHSDLIDLAEHKEDGWIMGIDEAGRGRELYSYLLLITY
jgi:hypothetical protein